MRHLTPEAAIYAAWIAWALSWLLAAGWSSRAARRLNFGAEAAYRVVTAVGCVLLLFPGRRASMMPGLVRIRHFRVAGPLVKPLWALLPATAWGMVGVTVAGFVFAWWARIHLGALWSGAVTRKADHRIVDTGPYGLVRHPIYTGLIAAAFALAVVKATPIALTGAASMTLGFWLKARLEEDFLRAELGPESYDAYRGRVPMLAPFWPV
jgi:protein-S-isoprenylcysteine O-methyltransferase Ste14